MNELEALLRAEIREHGPITFARYQDVALYHPELGYYARAQRTGWRGHFLTSAELDPAYGAMWAVGFRRVWEALGRPSDFEVIEVGPGEGGFANSFLGVVEGEFGEAVTYRLVERMPALAERQMSLLSTYDNAAWSSSLEEVAPAANGCVIVNEVLDNLPVHLLEFRGGEWFELYVGETASGLELVPGPPSDAGRALPVGGADLEPGDGRRVEVGLAAIDFVRGCAAAVERGSIFLVDYGVTWRGLAERPSGTLVAYSDAGADDLVLDRPGEKDITSHANWDVIATTLKGAGCEVGGPTAQREVLEDLGLAHLRASLAERQRDLTERGRGAEALRALSRRQALSVLSDPQGLGGLEVVIGRK
ncbi:MAG: class I SAM-dependent methyltransferase [Actinomycetota bacterium]